VEKCAKRHVGVAIFAIENSFDAEIPAIAILRVKRRGRRALRRYLMRKRHSIQGKDLLWRMEFVFLKQRKTMRIARFAPM
jgi:hypothetical protein